MAEFEVYPDDLINSVLDTLSTEVSQAKQSAESMGDVLIACVKEYQSTEKNRGYSTQRFFPAF